jgi:O-antigen ligase
MLSLKKENFFLWSNNIFDYLLLFYLTISIFNFDIFYKKDVISFSLILYLVFYYFSNPNKFYKKKDLFYIFIFILYLFLFQIYFVYTQTNSLENIFNLKFNKLLFNLSLFSFLILYKKNWLFFFEKLLLIVCFFLILIYIQNIILLDKIIISANIFFDYQNYNYDWASKNFLATFLNIILIFLNINFIKKKFFYFYFFIISIGIIFTLSRAGFYLYLLNLIYLCLVLESKIVKTIFICFCIILSSVFWNDTSRNFYMEKKINSQPGLYEAHKPKNFFNKNWITRNSESVRASYFFITFDNLKKNFLFGNGLNSFKNENKIYFDNFTIKRYPDPHSTWLILLYETGMVGFLIYVFLILKNKLYLLKEKNFKQKFDFFYFFLIILVASLFINILTSPIIWFLYSMRLNLKNEQQTN